MCKAQGGVHVKESKPFRVVRVTPTEHPDDENVWPSSFSHALEAKPMSGEEEEARVDTRSGDQPPMERLTASYSRSPPMNSSPSVMKSRALAASPISSNFSMVVTKAY